MIFHQFISTFRALLSALSRSEYPLVLFLDDLQWTDDATLELLEAMLTPKDTPLSTRHLLIVARGHPKRRSLGPNCPESPERISWLTPVCSHKKFMTEPKSFNSAEQNLLLSNAPHPALRLLRLPHKNLILARQLRSHRLDPPRLGSRSRPVYSSGTFLVVKLKSLTA